MSFNKKKYIKDKSKLEEDLKCYSSLFNPAIVSYLDSLLNLEFSVVRDYISEEERNMLSSHKIYNEISIYNIYYRAFNIFCLDNNKDSISIFNYNYPIFLLNVYCSFFEKRFPIFRFNVNNNFESTISLYKGVISDERRDAELERIFNKLIKLSDEKNPYYSDPDVYGGPATNWYFSHESSIKTYNDLFEKMCSSDGVSDEEKKQIELVNYFHELLLEDYGLKDENFQLENNSSYSDESLLNQTLVKRKSKIKIKNTIKYI